RRRHTRSYGDWSSDVCSSDLGVDRANAWHIVRKAALDSMPALRRSVLEELHRAEAATDTNAVAKAVRYPSSTTRRALEDLTAHEIGRASCREEGRSRGSEVDY